MDLSTYNNSVLKACLHELKEKTSGNKHELVLRLQAFDDARVKALIEKYSNGANTSVVDTSCGGNGEDSVASLKGEVAILKDTVQQLVQQLKNLVSVSDTSSSSKTNALPNAEAGEDTSLQQGIREQVIDTTATRVNLQEINNCEQPLVLLDVDPANEPHHMHVSMNTVPTTQRRNTSVHHASMSADGARNTYEGHSSVNDHFMHNPSVLTTSQADVRDVVRMMPDFSPGGGISSAMFVERVSKLSRAYGWSDQLLIYAVYDKLKGPARQWINAMPVFHRWDDFVQNFMADFPSEINTAELNMAMMRKRMHRDESYVEYFYKMLSLGRSGNMADSAISTYIINGLYDDTVKKILSAMQFPRCADLLRTLTNLPTDERKAVKAPYQNQTNPMSPKIQGAEKGSKNGQQAQTGIVCYRCRERGHIAKRCPKLQKRNTYERINHIDNAVEGDNVVENASINSIAVIKKSKEICKEISIGCEPTVTCCALIDSGSCKSLIKRSVADKSKELKSKCREKLMGFAGGELWCSEKIIVNVKIDDAAYPAELLIVDDSVMRYDAIIGIDVLEQGTVIIEKGVCKVMPIRSEQLKVGEQINEEVAKTLYQLVNTFSHCFGEELSELGRSNRFEMSIRLTSEKPIVRKPYQIPIPKEKVVEKIVEQLLDLGIIQPSHSLYASPILLVKKQNGENRMCVDFRALNAITEKQPWNMPTVEGVLAKLSNKRVFTILDMMSGYYQLNVEEKSRQYTAFVTHNGHFEFCRMPFGLRNAPSAFQRMMAEVIAPLKKTVVTYVDEVIIATETAEQNLEVLNELLQILEREGLTLRLSKCSFLQKRVSFLGHQVDADGVRPGTEKTVAIRNYPVPKNQAEVRRFLGLAGFFRKFVPRFAIIAQPISTLLRKNTEFNWDSKCEEAFRTLIGVLVNEPLLAIYDVKKEHMLHTDASGVGLAAILLQKDGEGYKPVAYYSRKCTAAESTYHAYELEVLAVVEACERFRSFLLGKSFTIVTDCQSIASAKMHKPMIPRVARWLLKLMEYDYQIVHRSGEVMRHVDALSRAPGPGITAIEDISANIMEISISDWVATLQRQDDKLKNIMDVLEGVKFSEQKKQFTNEYVLKNHRLFRKKDNKQWLVIPRGMRWRIVRLCHDEAGHPGLDGTMKRLLQNFWFSRATNFIKNYIKSCVDCSYHRTQQSKQCELYGMEIPVLPFQVLHMDHLGPFIKSRQGNEYLLIIVDALTRYSNITPVKSTKTKPVIETLNQITAHFGLPQTLVTDRGTAFTSATFEEFCQINNIKHIKVAVRTPRANGLAERVNQAVLNFLKTATNDQRDWDKQVRMLQWTLNTRPNTTTKMTPVELIYDFPLRDLSGNKLLSALYDDVHLEMNKRRDAASKNIEAAREKWKKRFDAKHKKPIQYNEGELVLLESPAPATGESRKLIPKYKGPYVVKKVLRYDRYLVEDVECAPRKTRSYSAVVACDKMKPWCSLLPEADESDGEDEAYDD